MPGMMLALALSLGLCACRDACGGWEDSTCSALYTGHSGVPSRILDARQLGDGLVWLCVIKPLANPGGGQAIRVGIGTRSSMGWTR